MFEACSNTFYSYSLFYLGRERERERERERVETLQKLFIITIHTVMTLSLLTSNPLVILKATVCHLTYKIPIEHTELGVAMVFSIKITLQ
jgi:hypothetical protein